MRRKRKENNRKAEEAANIRIIVKGPPHSAFRAGIKPREGGEDGRNQKMGRRKKEKERGFVFVCVWRVFLFFLA